MALELAVRAALSSLAAERVEGRLSDGVLTRLVRVFEKALRASTHGDNE